MLNILNWKKQQQRIYCFVRNSVRACVCVCVIPPPAQCHPTTWSHTHTVSEKTALKRSAVPQCVCAWCVCTLASDWPKTASCIWHGWFYLSSRCLSTNMSACVTTTREEGESAKQPFQLPAHLCCLTVPGKSQTGNAKSVCQYRGYFFKRWYVWLHNVATERADVSLMSAGFDDKTDGDEKNCRHAMGRSSGRSEARRGSGQSQNRKWHHPTVTISWRRQHTVEKNDSGEESGKFWGRRKCPEEDGLFPWTASRGSQPTFFLRDHTTSSSSSSTLLL